MAITWTKEWMASDDGTIVSGLDLKNIQDDITSGSTGDATSIWSVPIVQPTAADDGKVMVYDHSSPAFDYLTVSSIIPTGVILIWSGAISAVPSGWALCDGTAGTPNLTDRFVIHADSDSGGTNDVGDTGGASTHTLTKAELPTHVHTYDKGTLQSESDGLSSAFKTHTSTNSGDGSADGLNGDAHSNRDRYFALAYIMKT